MRKVNVTEFVSLDGVMESPHEWSGQYFSAEVGNFKQNELFARDALLLGRVTYEGFAAAWPSRIDDDGFADRMNSLPKYVASTTLTDPDWNNSTVITNVAEVVRKMKEEPGRAHLPARTGRVKNQT